MDKIDVLKKVLADKFQEDIVTTAWIGGSGTYSIDTTGEGFPEVLSCAGPKTVILKLTDVETPLEPVPLVKLINVDGKPVVRIPYHGWRLPKTGIEHSCASFWLLYQLGVTQVVIDSSVGGITAKPWDYVIPDDVFIHPVAKEKVAELAFILGRDPWVRMYQPFCPRISGILEAQALKLKKEGTEEPTHEIGDVLMGGTTITTPLSVFETPVEIEFYRNTVPRARVVNQSAGQEIALARILGMCIGILHPVANYAEGINNGAWTPGGMQQFYADCAMPTGVITYRTVREMINQSRDCQCAAIAKDADLAEITHPTY